MASKFKAGDLVRLIELPWPEKLHPEFPRTIAIGDEFVVASIESFRYDRDKFIVVIVGSSRELRLSDGRFALVTPAAIDNECVCPSTTLLAGHLPDCKYILHKGDAT